MKMKIRYISLLMVIISLMISTNLYAREGRSGLSTHGDNSELSVIADSLLIDQSSHNQLDNRINTLDTLQVVSAIDKKDTTSTLSADAHKEKKANKAVKRFPTIVSDCRRLRNANRSADCT